MWSELAFYMSIDSTSNLSLEFDSFLDLKRVNSKLVFQYQLEYQKVPLKFCKIEMME